ncbi:HNH endonuclease [Mycobacterium phage MacnCheese]|uniref:HNH endonuclease n=1 Tax=Mycobacterium phage MacnCheese TaxID=2927982 RepID=I6X3F8_9CAUD|nr:HNH endonuclease [Mycobacterium phage MacnCheese]AFN37787.1 HNH endonuclease [Mycobacterium phage MacnCheese]
MSEGRNTARRDRFRRHFKRRGDDCHLCGLPIDYSLPHDHLLSFQIDHITPLARGGTDTLDNCAAAHRKCNRDKSDSLPEGPLGGVTFVTDRTWQP